jgi:hypothetical protein
MLMRLSLQASTILSRPLFRGFFASDRKPEPDQEEQKKVRKLPRLFPCQIFTTSVAEDTGPPHRTTWLYWLEGGAFRVCAPVLSGRHRESF